MPIVIIDEAAVGVGELELRAGNECPGHRIFFLNDEGPRPLVPEGELLHPALDLDILGSAIRDTWLKIPIKAALHLLADTYFL